MSNLFWFPIWSSPSLSEFGSLSKESQKDWIKIIQLIKNSVYEKIIISYLQLNLKKEFVVMYLPCLWFKNFRGLSKENHKDWRRILRRKMLSCLICNGIWRKKPRWIFHAIPVLLSKMTSGRE